ncbi:BatD family protein [Coprobacter sp.]|uniref:BatD family protein n=1 Tax=Coprobacter sp. TaxID=1941478 RepID=UPI003AB11F49
MTKRIRFIMFVFFFISVATYGGNNVRFELIVPEKVYSGREFTIIFRLENAEGQDFRAPEFSGCQVIKGPEISHPSRYTMEWGIGRSLSYTDYAYILKTDRKKKVKIGAATVRVDGDLLKTASHTILLDKSSKQEYADNVISFTAVVPEKVEVGKTFKAVFVLKNAQGENFNLPVVKNCEFIYGPEVSRKGGFSFWGRTPIETVYTLILKAKKTGTVKFPSASVDVNGKVLKTKKVKIKILPESEKTRKTRFNEAQRKYQSI